jgi:hypothetical protein
MPRMQKAGVMAERKDPGALRPQAVAGQRGLLVRQILLAAMLTYCSAAQSETVSFAAEVQPILTQYCVMCHVPGAAQGGHALYPDAWKSMVNVPSTQSPLLLVKPGDPAASYSFLKVTGEHLAAGGSGEIMPFPHAPLAQDEINTFRQWIEQGAEQN